MEPKMFYKVTVVLSVRQSTTQRDYVKCILHNVQGLEDLKAKTSILIRDMGLQESMMRIDTVEEEQ